MVQHSIKSWMSILICFDHVRHHVTVVRGRIKVHITFVKVNILTFVRFVLIKKWSCINIANYYYSFILFESKGLEI